MREVFIANAPTFLDEVRDPDALQMDLEALARFDKAALVTRGTDSAPFFGPVGDMIADRLPHCERVSDQRRRSLAAHQRSRTLRRAGAKLRPSPVQHARVAQRCALMSVPIATALPECVVLGGRGGWLSRLSTRRFWAMSGPRRVVSHDYDGVAWLSLQKRC
jgi:hypothetical protein